MGSFYKSIFGEVLPTQAETKIKSVTNVTDTTNVDQTTRTGVTEALEKYTNLSANDKQKFLQELNNKYAEEVNERK